jgi:hypothetical protein
MSKLSCPACGHDFNTEEKKNTRVAKARREGILIKWFASLKVGDEWKKHVNENGELKVTEARQILTKLEADMMGADWDGKDWNSDYFKTRHWSNVERTNFESWVVDQLKSRFDRDLFGKRLKQDLGLPILELETEDLPDWVMALIMELGAERREQKKEIASLKGDKNRLDEKLLKYDDQERSQAPGTIDEHYMDSIRTLRYNAGMDIDLSQVDLLGGDKICSNTQGECRHRQDQPHQHDQPEGKIETSQQDLFGDEAQ